LHAQTTRDDGLFPSLQLRGARRRRSRIKDITKMHRNRSFAFVIASLLVACSKPIPREWQQLGLPLDARHCEVSEADGRQLTVLCPGRAADWQQRYNGLTSAGWTETGGHGGSVHLIEKGGVAIDWYVQQNTESNVRVHFDLRTARP